MSETYESDYGEDDTESVQGSSDHSGDVTGTGEDSGSEYLEDSEWEIMGDDRTEESSSSDTDNGAEEVCGSSDARDLDGISPDATAVGAEISTTVYTQVSVAETPVGQQHVQAPICAENSHPPHNCVLDRSCRLATSMELAYWQEYHVFICQLHSCLVPLSQLHRHFSTKHTRAYRFPSSSLGQFSSEQLKSAHSHFAKTFQIDPQQTYDNIVIPTNVIIPLLPKHERYLCSLIDSCPLHFNSKSSLELHHCIDHYTPRSLQDSMLQEKMFQLKGRTGSGNHWHMLDDTAGSDDSEGELDEQHSRFRDEFTSSLRTLQTDGTRQSQEHAIVLGWDALRNKLLKSGHSPVQLTSLLQKPKQQPKKCISTNQRGYDALYSDMLAFQKEATEHLTKTSRLKDILFPNQSITFAQEDTEKARARSVFRCLVAVMALSSRQPPIPELEIHGSAQLQDSASELCRILKDCPEHEEQMVSWVKGTLRPILRNVLVDMLCMPTSESHVISSPFDVSLFLESLRKDGTFRPFPAVTALSAHYQAYLRSIGVHLMLGMLSDAQGQSSGASTRNELEKRFSADVQKWFAINESPATVFGRMKRTWWMIGKFHATAATTVESDIHGDTIRYTKSSGTVDIRLSALKTMASKGEQAVLSAFTAVLPSEFACSESDARTLLENFIIEMEDVQSSEYSVFQQETARFESMIDKLMKLYRQSTDHHALFTGEGKLIRANAEKWEGKIQSFLQHHAAHFVATCGIPARGTTIADYGYASALDGRPRQLYVLDLEDCDGKMVAVVSNKDKGSKVRKFLVRTLHGMPQLLGAITVFYCGVVREIELELLPPQPTGDVTALDDREVFIYSSRDGRWAGSDVNAAVAEATYTHLGHKLSTRDLRQVYSHLSQEMFPKVANNPLSDALGSKRAHYSTLPADVAQQFLGIGRVWQTYFGLSGCDKRWTGLTQEILLSTPRSRAEEAVKVSTGNYSIQKARRYLCDMNFLLPSSGCRITVKLDPKPSILNLQNDRTPEVTIGDQVLVSVFQVLVWGCHKPKAKFDATDLNSNKQINDIAEACQIVAEVIFQQYLHEKCECDAIDQRLFHKSTYAGLLPLLAAQYPHEWEQFLDRLNDRQVDTGPDGHKNLFGGGEHRWDGPDGLEAQFRKNLEPNRSID